MWTKQKRRTDKGRFILPALTLAVVSYFSYHIYHGEYGLESREAAEQRIALLKTEYQALKAQNIRMRTKISLLQDGKIERDILDEYARRNLNVSKANELTIMTGAGDKAE